METEKDYLEKMTDAMRKETYYQSNLYEVSLSMSKFNP